MNYQQDNADNASVDEVLRALISEWSSAILAEMERPWILPKTYINDGYDGKGGDHQFLRNFPVTSVQQVAINGRVIPFAPIIPGQTPGFGGFGYRFEDWDGYPPGGPQAIELVGCQFYRGKLNVQISYTAGYEVFDEAWTIPAPSGADTTSKITVLEPQGIWAQDMGVKYANGTIFTQTPSNGPPTAAGQYQVVTPDQGSPLAPTGQYVFFTGAGGDSGAQVLISYGYIPGPLEQITKELVCERYVYRNRIGELTRSVNQQIAVKYRDDEFPRYVMPVLSRYRSILPL